MEVFLFFFSKNDERDTEKNDFSTGRCRILWKMMIVDVFWGLICFFMEESIGPC